MLMADSSRSNPRVVADKDSAATSRMYLARSSFAASVAPGESRVFRMIRRGNG